MYSNRNQDYNRDGRPDCVGIHVAGVGVITSQHFQVIYYSLMFEYSYLFSTSIDVSDNQSIIDIHLDT